MQQRSTKGASKQRRELINSEIIKIRDLLPTTESVRSHLSQLQVMSLCNSYVAKCNFFENAVSARSCLFEDLTIFVNSQFPDLSELLPGFLIMVTMDGKVLYLSENVIEYLGHSMVDILTHIDAFYDLIDSRDHKLLKEVLVGMKSGVHLQDEWSFTCRMGLAKKFHQNLGFYDQKSMVVRGFFTAPSFNPELLKPVFVALCTPRLKAAVASHPDILFDTMIFESLHELDMKYLDMSSNGEAHLGYSVDEIQFRSWYEFIHPDDSSRAAAVHKSLLYCESQSWNPLFVRMQRKDGHLIWMSILMKKVKNLNSDGREGIFCLNQIVREQDIIDGCEAGLMKTSHGRDFLSCPSLKEKDCFASSGTEGDFASRKCSGRDEVIRRLKRKMEINEMKRMKAFLPSENVSKSPSSSPEKPSSVFSFDFPSNRNAASNVMNIQKNIMNASAAVECLNYSPFSEHGSSSCSSLSSVFQSGSPVFQGGSPVFQSGSPVFQGTSSVFQGSSPVFQGSSPVFQGSSPLTPASSLSSPTTFGLSVVCPLDDVNDYVTSMPTPKFGKISKYLDSEVFETGYQEEEEVANIVEEMLERRPFHNGSAKVLGFRKEKRMNELPVLCPGTVADFFQEFEAAALSSGLESVLGLEDCHFAPFGVNSILSVGQTLLDAIETKYPSLSSSGQKMGKTWPESNMQSYLPGMRQGFAVDDMCDQGISAFRNVLNYDDMFELNKDQPSNGFYNLLTAG